MDSVQVIAALVDAGTSAILLAIMWQGLKRFDALLNVVINLAMLNSSNGVLRAQAEEQLRRTIDKP